MKISTTASFAVVVLAAGMLGAGPASAAKPTPGAATDKQVAQQCKKFGGTIYILPTRTGYDCTSPTRATVNDLVAINALCISWGGATFEGDESGWVCYGAVRS